jgi:hypothetical protein
MIARGPVRMERYVVAQEQDELWSVSHQNKKLCSFQTQEEAFRAALALAGEAAAHGICASALVLPPTTDLALVDLANRRRFSGM